MAERVYTVCRSEPEHAPPGKRQRVSQVSLKLHDDGRFELVKGDYYSDWGTRTQNSKTYSGIYTERSGAVVCTCESARDIDFASDHDWGRRELKDEKSSCREQFTFQQVDSITLLCGVDYAGFFGKSMDAKSTPATDQF